MAQPAGANAVAKDAAAVKMQKALRGHIVRADAQRHDGAAVTIQSVARGFLQRRRFTAMVLAHVAPSGITPQHVELVLRVQRRWRANRARRKWLAVLAALREASGRDTHATCPCAVSCGELA